MDEIKDYILGLPVFESLERYPTDWFFSGLGGWSLLFAIFVAILAIAFSFIVDKKYKWFEDIANKYLTVGFVVVWVYGFIVYDVGMYTGNPWSLLGNVPMAILHAFGLFILESDVSAIHEPFHNNWCFMAAFSMAHFLAALVSLIFVLKYFGFNIIAAIRRRLIKSSKKDTYIFWGMNEATYYLAKDIKNKVQTNDYRIIVIRTNTDTESGIAKNGIERLFNFLSIKSKDLDRLKELECLTANTYTNLANLESRADGNGTDNDILVKELRLRSVSRIIKSKTKERVYVFFLSENSDANIRAISNLSNDKTIQGFATHGKVNFYCHARYNSVHRVIEDEQMNANIEVKVIDSSHISIEQLKSNPELHPVNYVKVEDDATVSTPFNCMVIGFGEVGVDAVRFLYEFGAFVKKHKEGEKNIKRSEFHCHVIDKDMDQLAGQFVANAPSIKPALTFKQGSSPLEASISLYKMDCQSVDFYQLLEWKIKTLNYIVIATGDDETNISLAVRIFRMAIRYRVDMENFRILVRVQHDDNNHIFNIAEHYNRLWDAEMHSTKNDKKLHQKVTKSDKLEGKPISLFGLTENMYTYDNVVREALIESAKTYKAKYDKSIEKLQELSDHNIDPIVSWEDEEKKYRQLNDEYAGYSPTFSALMRLRRIQEQNIANSLHKATKVLLAEKALGKDYGILKENGVIRKELSLTYYWRNHSNMSITKYQKVLDTLAQTEHLRWNASHEILGYRTTQEEGDKDEARLIHGCIKDWKDLSPNTQSYDYNVVDVALGLIENN